MQLESPKFDYMESVWYIRQFVDDPEPSFLLRIFPTDDRSIVVRFCIPHKQSLLHRLIAVKCEQGFTAIADNYGLDELQDYTRYYLGHPIDDSVLKHTLIEWRKAHLNEAPPPNLIKNRLLTSLLPLTPLTDQLFFILFMDRIFLFKLGESLSTITRLLKKSDYPEYLVSDGRIKRLRHVPTWLRKGVFKRDQGHCVHCGKDLTGIRIIEEIHYDHIVALAAHGTNDPINWQLLCRDCNLSKSSNRWLPPQEIVRFW